MRIFWVTMDNNVEIFYCFLVIVYHLVRLGSFVDKANVCWDFFHTATEWEYRLLEFFYSAVSKSQVIKDIRLVSE